MTLHSESHCNDHLLYQKIDFILSSLFTSKSKFIYFDHQYNYDVSFKFKLYNSVMCQSQNLSFDLSIHLIDHQGEYLFTKGFIDSTLHLTTQPSPQCQFRFQQKSYLMRGEDYRPTKNQDVVFGTEILIRHIFSNFYLSIQLGDDGNQILKLRPDCNELCYFQILPQRTFQHKGDFVNFQSFFVIRHSISKCYLGSNLLETGPMRAKMQRQLKTSKIKQSYRLNDPLQFGDNEINIQNDPNKTFSLENMKNYIENQWEIREELADEVKRTQKKITTDNMNSIKDLKDANQSQQCVYLPLRTGKYDNKRIRECAIQKHIHTMWRAKKIQKIQHPFLQNNDYIYFISSNKNRGLMNISTKRSKIRSEVSEEIVEQSIIQFVKTQGENQYICSAIFIVEIIDRQNFYLKHMLTGKYFPFNTQNTKKSLKLKPLLPFNCLQNKLPPFHLLYQNAFYPPNIEEDASTCGFWLNKANKLEINQILSLEGVSHFEWIPYLLKFLDSNRKRRQEILQQFKLIRFLIQNLINSKQQSEQVYRLLFKMINNNQNGRKQVTQYLSSNILQSNKFFIIDILSEIFDNDMGYVQKYINPEQLGYILNDFKLEDTYSVIYMRIFRLFCGHHTQPCQRNQNLIFNFFFHSEKIKKRALTESVFILKNQAQIPKRFKFSLKKQKGIILFENCEQSKPFGQLSLQIQQYIRQYYYLLGDCIKLNKQNIQTFRSQLDHIYSIDILLDILQSSELKRLKGPILQLMNAIYLQPEYRYKLYVFINDYESMCYNGGLISLQGNQKITRLLNYITKQTNNIREICDEIDQKRNLLSTFKRDSQEIKLVLLKQEENVKEEFKSTQFKHLLLMIKFSIENAYWNNEDIVLNLVDIIGRFYSNKKSLSAQSHLNYGQISEWNNYMQSTIISIDIATLFIDIQINLALSHLITLPQNKVDDNEIAACARKIENNEQIRKYFNQFQLCDHENSKLIKKSLILSRKFYQLRNIIKEKYVQSINERIESRNMKNIIQVIKKTLYHIKLLNKNSLETCQLYITQCLPGIRIEDLTQTQILRQGYTLNAICRYRRPSHEFQVLAYRLGVLQLLKQDLYRYVNLRGKEKPQEQSHIYWKMILVYVLIKDNKQLRKQVSNWRRWLIALIREDEQRDGQIGILVIDILGEIYRNWRSLIVSDSEEILIICAQFVKLIGKDNGNYLGSNSQLNTKLNKILHLLGIFLTVQGRKIKNNFQLVVNEIFDKQNIIKCIIKMRNMDNFEYVKNSFTHQDQNSQIHNNVLFKLLLYLLTDTLQQKPQKIGFMLPDLSHMTNLIMAVGRNNWSLTFKIYNAIQYSQLDKDYFSLLRIFRANLNTGLQLIHEQVKKSTPQDSNSFNNCPQIKELLLHFPVMLKVGKMIFQKVIREKPSPSIRYSQLKLQIAERLSLISQFVSQSLRQKLFDIIFASEKQFSVSYETLQKLKQLHISDLTVDQIKNTKTSILSFVSNQKMISQRQSQRPNRNQRLRLTHQNNGPKLKINIEQNILSNKFCIDQARQFIRSLIYLNKSDSSNLDTELKTFFISFLTSTFPNPNQNIQSYDAYLKKHQQLLIQYGTAQLITTILQQKYRENRGLFINLFQLANKLLESGCQISQQTFLAIFKKDHKNVIFENITTIIQSSLIGIRFYYQQQDGYECEQNNEETIRLQRKQVCDILKRQFRFLQLLCQNDNQDLKKYIYSQTNEVGVVKYLSINFIEIAIYLLLQISTFSSRQLELQLFTCSEIDENLMETLLYILDFLIQVCQYPALKNQICLCNSDFFNILKKIKALSKLPRAQDKAIGKSIFLIQRKIVLLMRGLLQQRNEEIINTVSKKINEDHLKYLIDSSLKTIGVTSTQSLSKLKNHIDKKEDKLIDQIQNVVDVLIISKVLGFGVQKLFSPQFQNVLSEIDKKIRQIQVDFKGQVTKIYFCYLPIFDQLSQNTRAFFINRSSMLQSRNEKLRELINSRSIINQDIINRKSRQLIVSQNIISYLFTFSIILCFILLFLQLFFFSINTAGIALDSLQQSIVYNLAKMQFLIVGIYFSLWGVNISSITKEKMKSRLKIEVGSKASKIKYYWMLLKEIYLQENSSLHATLLFTLSFLSCWVDPRLYSLVLLYIFAKIETLGNILTAIRLTWGRLLVVCLLACAFTFVFGFLSINNYIRVLYENQSVDVDIGHIQSHCTSIIGCIDSLYTQRIIGETPSRQGETSHYGRFFSDTIHWAFFDILFTNIIAAIIIDKFAQLRNLKQKVQNQQKNRCFICSAQKSSIQRKNEDFEQHVTKRHCLWDYFYYLYYLQKLKDYTQYTGIEYWIVRQVKQNKIDWFPNDDALREDDDEKKLNSLFDLFYQRFHKELKEGKQIKEQNKM